MPIISSYTISSQTNTTAMAFVTINAGQFSLDIISPDISKGIEQDAALVHFHGGFLVHHIV